MKNRIFILIVPFVLAVFAWGCTDKPNAQSGGGGATPTIHVVGADTPPKAKYTAAPAVGDVKEYEKLQAVVETEKGNFFVEFFPKDAPKTVASFVKLSRDGFYDGLTFHRVEPGFVVQGGDPTGTGAGGPGYTLPAEFNSHKHVRGAVAMARTQDPNSAGSQFYVCLGAAPHLDGQYTIFGNVTKGMENVDKLVRGDRILKIRIEPKK